MLGRIEPVAFDRDIAFVDQLQQAREKVKSGAERGPPLDFADPQIGRGKTLTSSVRGKLSKETCGMERQDVLCRLPIA